MPWGGVSEGRGEERLFYQSYQILHTCLYDVVVKPINCLVNLDPVVQSIVSLTISLRHKFVKQISAKVTNTLLFFVEKM